MTVIFQGIDCQLNLQKSKRICITQAIAAIDSSFSFAAFLPVYVKAKTSYLIYRDFYYNRKS